jgi:hypothetical protein
MRGVAEKGSPLSLERVAVFRNVCQFFMELDRFFPRVL